MPTMTRETWTDERMDDLAKAVGTGFDRVDRRFELVDQRFEHVDRRFEQVQADIGAIRKEMATRGDLQEAVFTLRNEMKIRSGAIEERFDKMDDRFEKAEARAETRFDSLQQTLLLTGGGIIGTLVLGILSLIATQL
jgi:DNA anti-recombination protein RmuC